MKSFKEFEEELNEQQKVDGSDLHYNHEGKLQRLDQHTDLPGSIDYAKHMVKFHKPRSSKAGYAEKGDWYRAKDRLAAIQRYAKQKSKDR